MEQHRSVCPLEPVACEMKEFGCSVVVPRKELATHMRESELQHLTAMTVLNLRLSRQLQQDSTERDRKITQLQQDVAEMKTKFDEQMRLQQGELTELKDHFQRVEHMTHYIEDHTAGGTCKIFTVSFCRPYINKLYSSWDPFDSYHHDYKLKLQLKVWHTFYHMQLYLCLHNGEYDDQLQWPVEAKVRLEILNQAGNHHHIVNIGSVKWEKDKRDVNLFKIFYSDVEKQECGISYVKSGRMKFKIVYVSTQ